MVVPIKSSDDLKIYEDNCHYKVFAGPGAGKTYLIVENIKKIIEKSPQLKIDNRQILCITYTNAAAKEIVKRLGKDNKYVFVSTIHGFIYEHIIKDNQRQLKQIIREKFPINESTKMEFSDNLTFVPRQEGFRLISKKEEIAIRDFVKAESEMEIGDCSRTAIEECIVYIKELNKYPFDDTKEATIYNKKFNGELLLWIKYALWAKARKLDFDEILYFGHELIKKYKHIPYSLQYKFPYVIVDEFQDTNPIQTALIKKFADSKFCTLTVVGDVAQSIYSFQGANYKDFQNLKLSSKPTNEYVINGNRRSTANIIHLANYFRTADNVLETQECIFNTRNKDKITILLNKTQNNILDIIPSNTVVLCRRWVDVFQYIKGLSSAQQKLINDIQSHYTYAFKRDFFTEMEQERIDWIKIASFIVKTKEALRQKCMATIIQVADKFLDTSLFLKESTMQTINFKKFHQFVEKFNLITENMSFFEILKQINCWIDELNLSIKEPLELAKPEDEYYHEKLYNNINSLEYQTLKKMFNEVFNEDAKFMTIHRAKGKEFENVLVNIEPAKSDNVYTNSTRGVKSNMIPLNEILLNPIIFSEEEQPENEYVRIIYVGLSRAMNKLYICLNNSVNISQLEASLKKYMEKNNIEEPFYEIKEL